MESKKPSLVEVLFMTSGAVASLWPNYRRHRQVELPEVTIQTGVQWCAYKSYAYTHRHTPTIYMHIHIHLDTLSCASHTSAQHKHAKTNVYVLQAVKLTICKDFLIHRL